MRKLIVAFTASISLAGPAVAGGLEPSFDAQSAWSWTGCYAGGNAGGLWGSSEKWIVRTQGGAFEGQSVGHHDLDGWIGGIQAGCDYQMSSGFVIGVQGDYGWSNADGTHASARETGVFYHSEAESLASVTGRVGYAWDRFLGYVKGGAAWEHDSYSASTIIVGTAYTTSDTRSGWTLGGGGEYAINKFLSGFVEFNYFDFGTTDTRFNPRIPGLRPAFVDIEETASVVRAGLNLRFGR
jgi:outer membrane immunogenic protein